MGLFSRRKNPTSSAARPYLDFMGDASGAAEDELKSALASLYRTLPQVERAYLVRLRGGADDAPVGLAVSCSIGEDATVTDRSAKLFSQMFAPGNALDIIYLHPALEVEVKRSCTPFYEAA